MSSTLYLHADTDTCMHKCIFTADYTRDANHHDFCRIIPFFKADFSITISDVKIPQNNDFKMVPDKIKDFTLTYTPVLGTFYVAVDIYI